MSSIYDLTNDYELVYQQIQNGEDSQAYIDTLNSIDEAIEGKANGYAQIIKNLESDNEVISNEIKRLQERKKANANGVKRLKENLQYAMEQTNKKAFRTPLFSFGIQRNKSSVNVLDEDNIPKEYYYEQPMKLDKQRLLEELESGVEIEGAEIKQTESLRIR